MKGNNDYIPDIPFKQGRFGYARVLIEVCKCPGCSKWMVKKPRTGPEPFPPYFRLQLPVQLERAGILFISQSTDENDNPICTECEAAGKGGFRCALCKQVKTKAEETFGYPAESLCTDCYETTPAKVWDEKCDQLRNDHQWDFC